MLNSKKAVASWHNFCLERFGQEGATALRARKCNHFVLGFHLQKRREIRAQFDGGAIIEDDGVCYCGRPRNVSEFCASLLPASGIIPMVRSYAQDVPLRRTGFPARKEEPGSAQLCSPLAVRLF